MELTFTLGPGDRFPGFTAEPNECWALICSNLLRALTVTDADLHGALARTPWKSLVASLVMCRSHRGADGLRKFGVALTFVDFDE